MKNVTYISVELADTGRPKERPPKTNWKIEMIKKAMRALQHASPKKVAAIVWHYFTMPGKTPFTTAQMELIAEAETNEMVYRGDKIVTYRWGQDGPRVLLCHGWRSKTADFRRMVLAYRKAGYVVEGFDIRAHGRSEGVHTAMPEYRDMIKQFIAEKGRFDVVVGYSIGGIAAGMALSELSSELKPNKLFFIAAPPYIRYFFKDLIDELGYNQKVYERMTDMVEEAYHQPIDYFDLRNKQDKLNSISKYMIYCEDDDTVPFRKGVELHEAYPDSRFVQARGFGHYKIISHEEIIRYLIKHSETEVEELTLA